MWSSIKTVWTIFLHMFRRRVTIQYPEQQPYIPPRWRGRIILSRDPDGAERCVACYLCAVACPVAAGDRGRERTPLSRILPHQLLALHLLRIL
jgi:formate hydrogenlyase subunit 6/NADH:ubiquinone oxidoreductase subunit I